MPTLEEKLLEVIDYRNFRNFDREAFQSYNAEEIENCAKQAAIVSRDYAKRFTEWIVTNGWYREESKRILWINEHLEGVFSTDELQNKFESENK